MQVAAKKQKISSEKKFKTQRTNERSQEKVKLVEE